MFLLAALSFVDAVVPFAEDTPLDLIWRLKPDVLVKGGDYTPETIVGADEMPDWGGRVEVIPLLEGFSTSGLEEKIIALPKTQTDNLMKTSAVTVMEFLESIAPLDRQESYDNSGVIIGSPDQSSPG